MGRHRSNFCFHLSHQSWNIQFEFSQMLLARFEKWILCFSVFLMLDVHWKSMSQNLTLISDGLVNDWLEIQKSAKIFHLIKKINIKTIAHRLKVTLMIIHFPELFYCLLPIVLVHEYSDLLDFSIWSMLWWQLPCFISCAEFSARPIRRHKCKCLTSHQNTD